MKLYLSLTMSACEVDEVSFTPTYLFAWKTQSAVCLRSKQLLFETYLDPSSELMKLELCFDDNHELETVLNCSNKGDMLDVIPSFANLQDEYGETPLMLTVRGGKPCIAALKILLSSPHILIDCQNRRGQTALHLAASFADQTCTELLVRGGACVSVRDKLGLVPADVVPGGIKDSQKKFILGIMKKQKISK